ncbi:ABC TRANSPORTER [Encephalitozoon cuniculi GB-M1]|uniref:ABC TRANSPORTER n=1 Tax=Encephalitozoon cuniculi (strain GB-M1) TaxID=284813 RepID=Q8SSC7_ENCCU|nr:MdlB-like ABC transporter [Encephalitozoon cuniculi GB-M1]KMV66387.1 MdlB-like ABC transporter [Encephalitozoon cuniculi EcunIII-L]UYI28013.1 Fe-S clusters transporter Atm1 [Encephalitozoon cuniculi]CAD26170.1 ABC TRANSPORTER [Encephalitozoon cuniculi GB-M1]
MIRLKPRSNLIHGVSEIFGKYVLSRTYIYFMLFPIIFLATTANILYDYVPSVIVPRIAGHIKENDLDLHTHLVYEFFLYGVLAGIFEYFPIFIMAWIIQDIYRDCYRDVFMEYMSLEYSAFHDISPGDMKNRMYRKCKAVGEAVDVVVPTLMNSTIFVMVAMVDIYRSFGAAISLLFLVIPVSYISITVFLTSRRNRIRGRYNIAKDKSVRKLCDILNNYEIVKSFGLEERESEMFHASLRDRVTTGTVYSCSENIITFLQKLSSLVPHIGILYLSLNTNILTFDRAIKLNSLHSFLKERLTEFAKEFTELYEYYYDYSTSIYEKEKDFSEQVEIEGFNESIVVRDVGIKRGEKTILKEISFTLHKGEKLAIAGPNGAGKSTFINTLLRFLDYSGEILIDGVEMRKYTRRSTRQIMAYVPQDNCIVDDTVLRNLQYGNKDISFEKIKEICKRYGTHEVFSNLEGGYFKEAGQQGCELSVGQKQYLSLMRAIIKDAPIFILDEATSDVDYKTETELIDYVMSVLADRTIIMIVHNHSLLKKFDNILFLKNKTMKGYGNIKELLKSSEDFTDFYLGEELVPDTGIQP